MVDVYLSSNLKTTPTQWRFHGEPFHCMQVSLAEDGTGLGTASWRTAMHARGSRVLTGHRRTCFAETRSTITSAPAERKVSCRPPGMTTPR